MSISRRNVLATGAAAITTAAITAPLALKAGATKAALAGEEAEVLALFQQMGDEARASAHYWMRIISHLPRNAENAEKEDQLTRRLLGDKKWDGEARS